MGALANAGDFVGNPIIFQEPAQVSGNTTIDVP